MRTYVDDRLRLEAERFSFRFACDDCAHFDETRGQCSLGYPGGPRRVALAAGAAAHLELCKTFELG